MIKVEAGVIPFMSNLRNTRDAVMRNMLRFHLNIGLKLVKDIQTNVRDTFGRRPVQNPITLFSYGGTASSSGRSGKLRDSVKLDGSPGGELFVSVGGVGVPYAGIQEEGGEITPKSGKYLTIPSGNYANKRAREFDLVFGISPEWGKVLMERGTTNIAFLLRQRVTIPARPYIRPAVEKMNDEYGIRLALIDSFNGSPGVKIG